MPNYTPPSTGGGGGGALSGAAGGELAGTYPNPTVADAVIDDANVVVGGLTNAALASAAAIANTKLATNPLARANHTGTQAMATISDAGALATLSAVASAQITDGTIVGADLSSSIALPSGATSSTQSAADGSTKLATTAYVDTADALKANLASPTLTGTPTLPTGTIAVTQTVPNNSTKPATTAYADIGGQFGVASYLRNGSTVYRESMPWWAANGSPTVTSGVMSLVGLLLVTGDVVTSLSFESAATPLTQGSNNDGHWWFALYDSTRTLIAQTADQTTAAWTASATKTLALTGGPFTISSGQAGWGYAAVMVNAGTGGSPAVPNFRGHSSAAAHSTGVGNMKVACGTNGSALTTAAPGGPITVTATGNGPYCGVT